MSEEIVKFDPSTIMDQIKAKLKKTLVDVIPEEEWEKMIVSEYKTFFTDQEVKKEYGHGYDTKKSGLGGVVFEVMQSLAKEKIQAMMNDPKRRGDPWGDPESMLDEHIKKMIVEAAPDILMSMVRRGVADALQTLRTQNY